jgi:hypothetical protein
MLVINRRMSIIKQLGRENVHRRPPTITQLSKKNSSRNVIKNVFDVDLHHSPIRMSIEEGSYAKRDGLIASKGQYYKLMGG